MDSLTQIAAAKIGTPLVTINPQYQIEELRYVLQYSDTRTSGLDGKRPKYSLPQNAGRTLSIPI